MMNWNGCRKKGNRMKETDVAGVRVTNDGEEKCVQDFG